MDEPDQYVQSAEMYDLLSEQHWGARRASLLETLEASADLDGWVLDIGAGTGRGTALIAEAIPKSRIFAVEPSASMRVGLMTRVLASPVLRQRVTVAAEPFQTARLPPRVAAAFAFGCIGFFPPADRLQFWPRLREGLEPNGFALVDLMPIDRPREVPDACVAQANVGDQRYEIWLKGRPGEDDEIVWTMRFEVIRDGTSVRNFSIERVWHAFGLDQLRREAAEVGFTASVLADSPVPAAIFRPDSAR